MLPSREVFWNIHLGEIIYIIALAAVGLMVYAFWRRYRMWHIGAADPRPREKLSRRWSRFLSTTVIDGIVHRKFCGLADNLGHRSWRAGDLIPKEFYAGTMHFLIAIGCSLLLLGTALDVISHYIYDFIHGDFYFAHSLFTDIGGLMALIGVIMAVVRRYGQRPARLDNQIGDLAAILAIALIVVTGFVVEGLRMAASEIVPHPDWSRWSPGGYLLASALVNLGYDTLLTAHRTMWWIHALITFGALFYIAIYFNRLWHIIVSPFNVFFRNAGVRGAMIPIDMEKAESFGVSRIEQFSWKDLLDLDACTRCGRCADNCPANLSGKPLNPKNILQGLKSEWLKRAPVLLRAKPAADAGNGAEQKEAVENQPPTLIGETIPVDAIWNCTTCFACQEVCPVWAEPMFKIGEMRRNLVMEQAIIPETAEGALRSIEDRGHPWRGTMLTRTSWLEGMEIKTLAEDADVEILFWVGCTQALEDRSLKIARAIATLLRQSGIKFGVLGEEESCCGDPARRLGNEYLYQMQVQKNLETLKSYQIRKIVTGCPHCFNTLKNEYPQFGGNFEVIHHTEFILQLLKEGRLKAGSLPDCAVTYHDACYLGRYNFIFEQPRQILGQVGGIHLKETLRNRERSFCCGAGGGHLWLEEQKAGERINVMRADQTLATGAGLVATACPYCLQMFQDAFKTRGVEEKVRVMDIAEILLEAQNRAGKS